MALQDPQIDPFMDWMNAGLAPMPQDPLLQFGAPPPGMPIAGPEIGGPPVMPPPEAVPTVDPSLIEMDPPPPSMGFPHAPGGPLDLTNAPADVPRPVPDVLSGADHTNAADAVSGVDPFADGRPDLGAMRAARAQDPLANPDAQEAHQDLVANPELRGQLDLQHKQAQDKIRNTAMLEAATRSEQAAMDNMAALRKSQATAAEARQRLEFDAVNLANEKQGFDAMTTGQQVAGVIASVLGGLASSSTGGRNMGMEMLNQAIEEGAQKRRSKQAEIERRRGAINDNQTIANDTFRSEDAFRIAAYEQAARMADAQAQNFDPQGTSRLELAKFSMQLRSQAAKALDDHTEKVQKATFEAIKIDQEQQKIDITRAAADAKAAKAAGAGAGKPTLPPEYFEGMGLTRPPRPMTEAEYSKWQQQIKAGKEIDKVGQEIVTGGATLSKEQLEHGVGNLKQADGKTPFVAQGSPEAVNDLRKSVASTRTLVRLMDEALVLRSGWTSNVNRSEEWQQLQANWKNAVGVAGQVLGLGALSDEDFKLAAGFIGTDDPTQYRDPTAGIEKARENIVRMTRDKLEAAAPEGGVKFDIPKIKIEPPKPSVSDLAFEKAKKKPTETNAIAANKNWHTGTSMDELYRPFVGKGEEPKLDNIVMPDTRTYIDGLATMAKGGGDKSQEALLQLQSLASEGGNSAIRNAAQSALLAVGTADISATSQVQRSTHVVHEEAPPRAPREPNKPKGHH